MFNEEDNRDSFEYHEIYGKKKLLQKDQEKDNTTRSLFWYQVLFCCRCFALIK